MELYPEQLFMVQKYCTSICQEMNKPMIVATQMMESMTENSRPTRAEVTDVGQAVYDFNDGTMLSGETGNGKFPVESVKIMGDICRQTEDNMNYKEHY